MAHRFYTDYRSIDTTLSEVNLLPQVLTEEALTAAISKHSQTAKVWTRSLPPKGVVMWDGSIPFRVFHRPENFKPGSIIAFPVCYIPIDHENSEIVITKRRHFHPCLVDGDHPFEYQTPEHYQVPPFCINLDCIDQLGEAILGQHEWTDTAYGISHILLGKDRDAAWNYVTAWRKAMSISIHRQWTYLKQVENATYDSRSFFQEESSDLESEKDMVSVEVIAPNFDSDIDSSEEGEEGEEGEEDDD
jgi:hypothetical protein